MTVLMQMLGWSLLATVAAMTSDPAYYSQTPLHARPAPFRQLYPLPLRAASYAYPSRGSATIGRPYDMDYTGRQLRYRPATDVPLYGGNTNDMGYRPAAVASYTSDAQHYGGDTNGGYYRPQPMRNEGYRKVSYEAPGYADDGGRIAGNYMVRGFGGARNSRPYPDQQARGYLGDASII